VAHRVRIALLSILSLACLLSASPATPVAGAFGEAIPKLTKSFAQRATQQALEKLHPRVHLPTGASGRQRDKPSDPGYTEGLGWYVKVEQCREDKALASRYHTTLVCPSDVVQRDRYFEAETPDTTGACPTGELAVLGIPGVTCDHWATREQTFEQWSCPEVFVFGPHHSQEHHGSKKFLDVEVPGGAHGWFISVLVETHLFSRACPNETGLVETLTWTDGDPTRTFKDGETDPFR
jgi:hypothetical protein